MASSASRSIRVLVIDDNMDVANLMGMFLRAHSFDVDTANDGATGLRKAQQLQPLAVLLDIGLPDIDGYQVAAQLRESGFQGLLIAVSGHGEPDDIRRAFDAGFDHHVLKPAEPKELVRLIREQAAHLARS